MVKNVSQIWIGKMMLDQKLEIVSDQQTLAFLQLRHFISLKISHFSSFENL